MARNYYLFGTGATTECLLKTLEDYASSVCDCWSFEDIGDEFAHPDLGDSVRVYCTRERIECMADALAGVYVPDVSRRSTPEEIAAAATAAEVPDQGLLSWMQRRGIECTDYDVNGITLFPSHAILAHGEDGWTVW